jgi:hypothetical protein
MGTGCGEWPCADLTLPTGERRACCYDHLALIKLMPVGRVVPRLTGAHPCPDPVELVTPAGPDHWQHRCNTCGATTYTASPVHVWAQREGSADAPR